MNASDQLREETPLLCPIRCALDAIGGKWKLPILCLLANASPLRYSAIKRKMPGITNMMLAQSLREMEGSGIVSRHQFNEVPPHVEYALAEEGRRLLPALYELASWGNAQIAGNVAASSACAVCRADAKDDDKRASR